MSNDTTVVQPLSDIQDVEPYSEKDEALFAELKAVLERHNAASRFGISLLHSHFPIGNDEILCETTDTENRHQTVTPVQKSALADQPHIVTNWRLDQSGPVMGCVCVTINGHGHFTQN